MASHVHRSFEVYVRGAGGDLLETGKHVLLMGDPEVGMEVKLRYSPAWVTTKVTEVEGCRVVVESVLPTSVLVPPQEESP